MKTPYEAGGFAFPNEAMMGKAVKEGEGIRYIKKSADMRDPQVVFRVYCQMVEQRLFETPVGYVYLHELQDYLLANPSIRNTDIPPIPVIIHTEDSPKKETSSEKKEKTAVSKTKAVASVKKQDYRPRFRASLTVNIILLLIVIGMFLVASTSGNINIVNYENALIEKYESWETQLKEREEKLNERERGLEEKQIPLEGDSP